MRSHFQILAILTCLFGCVEPYDFQVTETAEVLVVDAVLTNEQKAHIVKLSISGALDAQESNPVSGASVWFVTNGDTQINLSETVAGTYETDPTVIGVPGQSYTLYVTLVDGTTYSSSAEQLPSPIAIDEVYGRYMEIPSTENSEILQGIQFFVDSYGESSDVSNFRFEYMEDFEVRVPFPSLFEWNENTETYSQREEDVGICYDHENSVDLIIATTNGLSKNELTEFPIRMVNREEAQLNFKYSITINQHTITSAAYQYYKNLKENNESSGSFFDKQKGTVAGNISNQSDPTVPVLGFFEVSSVSSKTSFFVPDDFLEEGFIPRDPVRFGCTYSQVSDSINSNNLSNSTVSGRNIYEFTFPIPDTVILVTQPCSDCRFHGDLKKPDFWD